MRKSITPLAVILLTAAMPILGLVAPAQASPPQAVAIVVSTDLVTGTTQWSASGAFVDSGWFSDEPGVPAWGVGMSPFMYTYHVVRTFTGSRGSFTTRTDVRVYATDDQGVFTVTGRWAVLSGTGAYDGLHGAGSVAETLNLSTYVLAGTWPGSVLIR